MRITLIGYLFAGVGDQPRGLFSKDTFIRSIVHSTRSGGRPGKMNPTREPGPEPE